MQKIIKWIIDNKWILIIVGLGTVLRFYKLNYQDPWLDEISTLQVTDPSLNFSETNWLIMNRDGFPHFYFLSLKWLSYIFGHTIFILRFFSAFFGSLTIYYVYRLLKELFSKNYGYIGAAIFSVNYFHIFHSQEARCYTLLVFFVVFATYRLLLFLKSKTIKNAIFFGIAIGLIPNAHPLGFLNIAVLFSILFSVLFFEKEIKNNVKQLFIIFSLIVLFSIPLLHKLLVLSNIQSFWIPEMSIETVKNAFYELLGSNNITFYFFSISLLLSIPISLIILVYKRNKPKKFNEKVVFPLLFFWFSINIGVILLKSYFSISIILNRYFIGSLGLFILALVYLLYLFKNKWLNIIVTSVIIISSIYYLIIQNKYYETVTKTQFYQLSNEIKSLHNNKDKIYSAYGFVTNILFKETPCYRKLREVTFDDYLNEIRANPTSIESFWYFDGNFRPYLLSVENQIFIEANYIMDINIEKKDCWARHYIPKKNNKNPIIESTLLTLEDFETIKLEGNMHYMFQNGTINSNILYLKKGKYELIIEAKSYPTDPINNENAIIQIKINETNIWKGQIASEEKINPINLNLEIKDDKPKRVSISYLNDVIVGNEDRNLGLKNIILKKIN